SDVYQDLLKEGSYTGKGIIDIDAFRQVLHDRMPENRILSHDLLEGCHARSGLVSDVQLYEDYPAAYLADMRRRHRWIRGDWQIARWLFPKVPDAQGHDQHNPISALSLWKISDNLRRSLVAPALLSMFLFGWLISPDPWFWMMIAVVTLLPAPLLALLYSVITKRKEVPQLHHTVTALEAFVTHVLGQIWTIVSLPYEALVNLDAILRTLWRVLVSHKNLLQWDPSNTTNGLKNIRAHFMEMWEGPALGIGMIITLSILSVSTLILSSPVLILWITSPLLAWLISLPQTARQASLSASQLVYLRKLSRRTWAYFDRFIGPEDHWLPPDNIQEYPSAKTAHRTSPTNIGVTLLSYLAAFDFGYIGTSEFIDRCQKTFATIQLLDRFKDHLFNWYDTITLAPLHPRYVSTVDSGNFIACLLTLKEGLLSIKESQGQTPNRLQGLEDTLSILMDFEGVPQSFKKLRHELQSALIQGADSSPLIRHYAEQILAAAEAVSQPQTSTSDELHSWIESLVRQCKGILSELEDKTPKQWKEQEDKLEELVEKCLAWS
ncbi:MAG TPA: hypothetical protein VJ508_12650, partial [Saprospiraceae bacterium]|nr:hypothetical protein [Saprospiraceae bacterium]